jgi:hypothetical protein
MLHEARAKRSLILAHSGLVVHPSVSSSVFEIPNGGRCEHTFERIEACKLCHYMLYFTFKTAFTLRYCNCTTLPDRVPIYDTPSFSLALSINMLRRI